jgi:hypothetical protein
MLRNHNPYLKSTDIQWKDKRRDYTSGNLDYEGFSLTHKASITTGDLWWIWKYTWDATPDKTRDEGPLVGNWSGRADLDWA